MFSTKKKNQKIRKNAKLPFSYDTSLNVSIALNKHLTAKLNFHENKKSKISKNLKNPKNPKKKLKN